MRIYRDKDFNIYSNIINLLEKSNLIRVQRSSAQMKKKED